MAEKKYLDYDGLLYVKQKLQTKFNDKVDKTAGKGLSTNDFTNDYKSKLDGLKNYDLPTASATTLGGVKVGAGLTISNGVLSSTGGGTADAVEWTNVLNKPTKLGDFTNDQNYQTGTQVSSAIADALKDVTGIKYSIVTTLPATGETGTIYLIADTHSDSNDSYDEYIYVNSKFEKIGNTDVDLSGYVQTGDLVAITNDEIDTIFA